MAIILNTELCWPLAAVGPNNAVVELFEHARRGVLGDNVSNPAKLPDEASRSHTPAVRQLQVLDATARWLSSIVASEPVDLHVHAVALLERDSASSNALAEHRVNHGRAHLEHLPVSIGQRAGRDGSV